jgi:hypothetical protein
MTALVIDLNEVRTARRARTDTPEPLPQPPREFTVAEAIRFCLARPELLSDWEAMFLTSIRGQEQWGYRLSPKQLRVLGNILGKIEGTAAESRRTP